MQVRLPAKLLSLLALFAAGLPSAAQSSARYYVDVGAPGSTPSNAYSGAAGAPGVWNGFSATSVGAVPLLNAAGVSSGVSLSILGGQGNFAFDNAATQGDDQALMDDTGDLNLSGGGLDTAVYTFSGLPNGRYRVFVYAWAPDAPAFTTDSRPSGGQPCTTTCGGANWTGAHVEGATYVTQDVSVSTGQLTIDAASNLGWGSVNGLQVVPLGTTLGTVMGVDIEPPPGSPVPCATTEPLVPRGLVFAHDFLWISYSTEAFDVKCIKRFDWKDPSPPTSVPELLENELPTSAGHAGPTTGRLISGSPQVLVRDNVNARVGVYTVTSGGALQCDYIAQPVGSGPIPFGRTGAAVDDDIPGTYWTLDENGQVEEYHVPFSGGVLGPPNVAPYPFADCYGLAYDWVSNVMWAMTRSNDCGILDHLVEFQAFDPSTGVPTGQRFMGAVDLPLPNRALASSATVYNGSVAIVALHECAGGNRVVIYDLGVPAPANVVTYCTSGTSTSGCDASISASGLLSASLSSPCVLNIASVDGQRQGLFFYGVDNAGFTPMPWGTGTSFLCVKSPTQRTPAMTSGGTSGLCDGAFSLDLHAFLTANPSALGAPFSVGDKVYVQGWYRDPPAPKTTNLSNGLELTAVP